MYTYVWYIYVCVKCVLACMSICECVYVILCPYIYIYIYMCVCVCMCVVFMCMCMYTSVYACMNVCDLYIYPVCICRCVVRVFMYIYIYIYDYIWDHCTRYTLPPPLSGIWLNALFRCCRCCCCPIRFDGGNRVFLLTRRLPRQNGWRIRLWRNNRPEMMQEEAYKNKTKNRENNKIKNMNQGVVIRALGWFGCLTELTNNKQRGFMGFSRRRKNWKKKFLKNIHHE